MEAGDGWEVGQVAGSGGLARLMTTEGLSYGAKGVRRGRWRRRPTTWRVVGWECAALAPPRLVPSRGQRCQGCTRRRSPREETFAFSVGTMLNGRRGVRRCGVGRRATGCASLGTASNRHGRPVVDRRLATAPSSLCCPRWTSKVAGGAGWAAETGARR